MQSTFSLNKPVFSIRIGSKCELVVTNTQYEGGFVKEVMFSWNLRVSLDYSPKIKNTQALYDDLFSFVRVITATLRNDSVAR